MLNSIPLKSFVISNNYYLLGACYYLVRALYVILLLVITLMLEDNHSGSILLFCLLGNFPFCEVPLSNLGNSSWAFTSPCTPHQGLGAVISPGGGK